MKSRNGEIIKSVKEANTHYAEQVASEQNTLRTLDKIRRYDQLFHDGFSLGASGGVLDNETELVEENGKMIPKKDHRNFKQGYKKGLEVFKIRLATNSQDTHKTR